LKQTTWNKVFFLIYIFIFLYKVLIMIWGISFLFGKGK